MFYPLELSMHEESRRCKRGVSVGGRAIRCDGQVETWGQRIVEEGQGVSRTVPYTVRMRECSFWVCEPTMVEYGCD